MPENKPEEILPEGVELFDFDDVDTWRGKLYGDTLEAVRSSFPKTYGNVRLEVEDLEYDGPETVSLQEEREHLLSNRDLTRRLRGRLKLYDNETGDLLDDQKKTLMRVPVMTEHGTFVHNGTSYSPLRQQRLMPGVFTRRKQSGETEVQFNTRQGTGPGFRIELDPKTSIYRMQLGTSQVRLYSFLHDLGVPDEVLEEAWGPDVLEANRKAYDSGAFQKAYTRFMGYRADPEASREDKVEQLRARLNEGRVSREVLKRTLPGYFKSRESRE